MKITYNQRVVHSFVKQGVAWRWPSRVETCCDSRSDIYVLIALNDTYILIVLNNIYVILKC
jgi:hypothetical protein